MRAYVLSTSFSRHPDLFAGRAACELSKALVEKGVDVVQFSGGRVL